MEWPSPVVELPESLVHVACVAVRTMPHLSAVECLEAAQYALRTWQNGKEDFARVVVAAFLKEEARRLSVEDPRLEPEEAMAIAIVAFHVCVAQCYRT